MPRTPRLLLPLLIIALLLVSHPGLQRNAQAVGPGFTAADKAFTPTTLPEAAVNPIPTGVAGGVIFFVVEEVPPPGYPATCPNPVSLRVKTDPAQIDKIGGSPVPAGGYVILRKSWHINSQAACEATTADANNAPLANGASDIQLAPASIHAIGAYDIPATNTTRVLITFQRTEGGYKPGQNCVAAADGAADLNNDGDLYDQVVQYAELTADRANKDIVAVQPSVNTGFMAGQSLVTNGRYIAGFINEADLKNSCANPAPAGTDLNGDGFIGSDILRLYDVDASPANSTINTGMSWGQPGCGSPHPGVAAPQGAGAIVPMLVIGSDFLAFASSEVSPIACAGQDFNGDGDADDRVARYIDLGLVGAPGTAPVSLGPTLSQSSSATTDAWVYGTDARRIALAVREEGIGFSSCPGDLNGDNDCGDTVMHLFEPGQATPLRNAGAGATFGEFSISTDTSARFSRGVVAFLTRELGEGMAGTDLNCDGDVNDTILRYVDAATSTVVNTRIASVNNDTSNTTTERRALVGTDGALILYEDFPQPSPPTPIQRINYIEPALGTTAAACAGGSTPTPTPPADADGDGFPDAQDQCPGTPAGAPVQPTGNAAGCPLGTSVVNTTADTDDGACTALGTGNGCSLREALNAANANADLSTINFNIPAASDAGCDATTGVCTIMPGAGGLPNVTSPTRVDGYTQPGASPNTNATTAGSNAALKIVLRGVSAGAGVDGLRLSGGGSTVRGLVINGFSDDGISIVANSDNNVIRGNFIGTDAAGVTDLGNSNDGISSDVSLVTQTPQNTVIGGTDPADRNVISGNNDEGIEFFFASDNTVQGNIIGLRANGVDALGNGGSGITLSSSGGANNLIGGSTASARNVISGNGGAGIGTTSSGATISGNYIGTDVSGTLDRGNAGHGISTNVSTFTIGGAAAGAGNVISGNGGNGIFLGNSANNVVRGNFIGTRADGTSPLGNGSDGVEIFAGTPNNNTVGGTGAGERNVIAFNLGDGVFITHGVGNSVRGNSIHSNGGLGVDLGANGVTPNDADDPDAGANNQQNFPVVASAITGSSTVVKGALNSTPNTQFFLDFYANGTCDGTHGEGATYLGSTTVTTDAGGDTTFTFTPASPVAAGQIVTATATRSLTPRDTSEFSQCLTVEADADDDGVLDGADNCQFIANTDQADADGDGQGNACDADDDDDGHTDAAELAAGSDPLNAASTPEECDGVDNDLNDGVDEGFADTDQDGQADCVDADDDNDGQSDANETACGSDPLSAASKATDTDGDARPDCVDDDDDNDTVLDANDNCPLASNPGQANNDGDAQGDACDPDDDNDGVADSGDNCPLTHNTDQRDNDQDWVGDVCDIDDDNDGVPDAGDNCPLTYNPAQTDSDSDGLGDACDQAAAFNVCPLYDQTKAHKSGSTIPIKLRLCDAAGNNLSSANIPVVAIGIRKESAVAYGAAEDSGHANPDGNFRYDPTLGGPGGGYIFNLSTKGLGTGAYVLGFRAGLDPIIYTVQFQVR